MKVLWFTNTPANADEYFDMTLKGTGGWLKALNKELQNHVDLHVAFYNNYSKTFNYQKTTYYPIRDKKSLIRKVLRKFGYTYVIDEEDLKVYLDIIYLVKPDIIHIHGTENPFGCLIKHTQTPVVVSLQGIINVITNMYFNGFEKKYLSISGRQTSRFIDFLFPYRFSYEYHSFKKRSDIELRNFLATKNIIGRTDWDRRVCQILAPKSKYFINNEILRDLFYSTSWHNPVKEKKIIIHSTIGNHFYKGFETLSLALKLLNDTGLNCEWRVAGINSSDLVYKLGKIKLKQNFPNRGLVLLGKMDEKALIKHMLEANVYVMTSHIENSPNNLCEAMILGMPCISTFVGGSGSLISDKVNGLLIQSGDPWAMAGAILEMACNNDKAILFGNKARDEAQKRHNRDKIVSDLLSIYGKLVKENSATSN